MHFLLSALCSLTRLSLQLLDCPPRKKTQWCCWFLEHEASQMHRGRSGSCWAGTAAGERAGGLRGSGLGGPVPALLTGGPGPTSPGPQLEHKLCVPRANGAGSPAPRTAAPGVSEPAGTPAAPGTTGRGEQGELGRGAGRRVLVRSRQRRERGRAGGAGARGCRGVTLVNTKPTRILQPRPDPQGLRNRVRSWP